ncbi:MAG: hypothetical protein CME62_03285 [Halobacteriovoraceae bacterium]|nr:hypothetical protein [Halobacteriovoraceae bacterium]|tara:strand:+ start:8392 stop:9057 length:666 start_codon:yes stop_codon:yes gene_type:complete
MHTKFRPLFILFALFVMGIGCYFFYGLKTGMLFKNIEKARVGKNIKDENVEIYSTNISQYIKRTTFKLEKPNCTVAWDVISDSLAFGKQLRLIYAPSQAQKCQINQALFESYQLSVLKKVIKRYDPKDFNKIELSQLKDWPFIDDLAKLQDQLKTISPPRVDTLEVISLFKKNNSFKNLKDLFKRFDMDIELENMGVTSISLEKQTLAASHVVFSVEFKKD